MFGQVVFTEDFPDWVSLREVRATNAPFDRAMSRSFWPSLSYQIKPGQSKDVALRVLRSMLRRGEVTVSRQPTNRPHKDQPASQANTQTNQRTNHLHILSRC